MFLLLFRKVWNHLGQIETRNTWTRLLIWRVCANKAIVIVTTSSILWHASYHFVVFDGVIVQILFRIRNWAIFICHAYIDAIVKMINFCWCVFLIHFFKLLLVILILFRQKFNLILHNFDLFIFIIEFLWKSFCLINEFLLYFFIFLVIYLSLLFYTFICLW